MAAALSAAEGGIFFQNYQGGGYIQNSSGQGVYPHTPYSRPLILLLDTWADNANRVGGVLFGITSISENFWE